MRVKFEVKIESGNAAFAEDARAETCHILDEVRKWIEGGRSGEVSLYDSNGNTVGHAFLGIEDDDEDD